MSTFINDTNMLTEAAIDGKLDVRADDSKHGGDFKNIIVGFNNTLNSIVDPINEAINIMKKLSVNDFTLEMKGLYKGKMKEFSDEINLVHTRLDGIQSAFIEISRSSW